MLVRAVFSSESPGHCGLTPTQGDALLGRSGEALGIHPPETKLLQLRLILGIGPKPSIEPGMAQFAQGAFLDLAHAFARAFERRPI